MLGAAGLGDERADGGARPAGSDQLSSTTITLRLPDPTAPDAPPRPYQLKQFRQPNGFPAGYALSLVSHVCADSKCRPLEVTLYWDALGDYSRLEYPPGRPLTKKEHEPFSAADYAKLDRILKDRNSILANYSLAHLVQPAEEGSGVDAWTEATPVTVEQSVVKDAAYTTWVLWRWVNGPIVEQLRHITEQHCTPAYLKHLLATSDMRYVDFALHYVLAHAPTDGQYVDAVFDVLPRCDRPQIKLAMRYLSGAVKDKVQLHKRLIAACWRMKSIHRPLVLDYLASQPELAPTTVEALTAHLDQLPYFEVHLILRMLESHRLFSATTERNVARLLDGDNFFTARRAYEHLMRHHVSERTGQQLDAFRQRYRDRL